MSRVWKVAGQEWVSRPEGWLEMRSVVHTLAAMEAPKWLAVVRRMVERMRLSFDERPVLTLHENLHLANHLLRSKSDWVVTLCAVGEIADAARSALVKSCQTQNLGSSPFRACRSLALRSTLGFAALIWQSSVKILSPSLSAVVGIVLKHRHCAYVSRQPVSTQLARQQVPEWDLDPCSTSLADSFVPS